MRKKIVLIFFMVLCSWFMLDLNFSEMEATEREAIEEETTSPLIVSTNWEDYRLIAHGLGGLDGQYRVTNSLEALEQHYQNGTRLFEVDLIETSDGTVVARHDWEAYLFRDLGQSYECEKICPLATSEFLNLKIQNQYTPLTIDDLVKLMKKYPDIYLITDTKTQTKEDTSRIFQKILEAFKEETELLERLIPQFYSPQSFEGMQSVYPFKETLYTIYLTNPPRQELIEFAKKNEVMGIVLPEHHYSVELIESIKSQELKVFLHTINDIEDAKRYLELGIDGIYTDFLFEDEI